MHNTAGWGVIIRNNITLYFLSIDLPRKCIYVMQCIGVPGRSMVELRFRELFGSRCPTDIGLRYSKDLLCLEQMQKWSFTRKTTGS